MRSAALRLSLLTGLLTVVAAGGVRAEREVMPFLDYRTESWFLPQSPGVTGGPAAALFNPAAWSANDRVGLDQWTVTPDDQFLPGGAEDYGFSFGRKLGFAMNTREFRSEGLNQRVFDYQLGLAGGDRERIFGLAFRWSHGDRARMPRQQAIVAGAIWRRRSWLSLGGSGVHSLESEASQAVLDVGLRPFGRDAFTFFFDWTANDDERFLQDGTFSAGFEVRPLRGLHLGLRAHENPADGRIDFAAVGSVTWGSTHYTYLPVYDPDGNRLRAGLLSRGSPPFRGLPVAYPSLRNRGGRYYPLNLEHRYLTYQKYRWGDDRRLAWLDLLAVLNRLRDDIQIQGVAVNLAGFSGRPSLLWELRGKLDEIRRTGKEVVVHLDRPDALTYWLATVADRVIIDPSGMLPLPGVALGRSYLKGTLDELGLGFQEFRYLEYKSAMETFSREDMSEADREQRQRIVDVVYETLRDGVVRGRSLEVAAFDAIVDSLAVLSPDEAFAQGLVDTVGRWNDLVKWVGDKRHCKLWSGRLGDLGRRYYDEQWGKPLRIPVVYAVGSCAMDSGLRGRATSAYLRKLVKDDGVPAVVLRADSPGGDVLPSDLIADAVRELREAGKPVIVSQGDVAASGGYWISMDGTQILTTPLTITGSIGVIGGWVWDDGFAAKLGVTADSVQRGRHADLLTTVNLPFLGGIPRRPLDEAELARVRQVILAQYDSFVAAVAAGRELPPERVAALAEGRVWMGGDAVARSLCDGYGGLDDAIVLARQLAGVPAWREVETVEYPPRPLFEWPSLMPRLPGLLGIGDRWNGWVARLAGLDPQAEARVGDEVPAPLVLPWAPGLGGLDLAYLQALSHSPGRPLLMVAPDLLPEGWRELD